MLLKLLINKIFKISKDEICEAHLIRPTNGPSLAVFVALKSLYQPETRVKPIDRDQIINFFQTIVQRLTCDLFFSFRHVTSCYFTVIRRGSI